MSIEPFDRDGILYFRGWIAGPGGETIKVYKSTGLRFAGQDAAGLDRLRQAWEARLLKDALDAANGAGPSVSFRKVARAYLDFEPRSAGTVWRVERLIEHFGRQAMTSIRQDAADEAVRVLCKPGVTGSTKVRQVYGPLTTIFEFGAVDSRGWCPRRRFDKPRVARTTPVWLTPAQVLAIENAAPKHLKALIRFLACTGARLSEALDLDWADVDLAAARVVFRNTKAEKLSESARPRVARLPLAAIAALANLPAVDDRGEPCERRQGKVFRTDMGEPYADRNREEGGQIRSAWATACRNAGLPGKMRRQVRKLHWTPKGERRFGGDRYRGKAGVKQTRLVIQQVFVPTHGPHDLRHSWATWAYGLTKDLMLLADEGGWSGTKIVERYAHLMDSSLVPTIALVWGSSHPRFGALPVPVAQPAAAEVRLA